VVSAALREIRGGNTSMRGMTTTTRGSSHYPTEQSIIVKRNATEADLLAAQQQYVGKIVKLAPQSELQNPPVYRCAAIRLDNLKRLIFDLLKQENTASLEHSERSQRQE
ncbi:MAG: hypothetical protein ACRDHW_22130, partial [Ktedonobacteraceae bacterium]